MKDTEEEIISRQTADERKTVIEVKNLYKIYKVGTTKVHALNGVDFQVQEGEFCAIVGTSGSGKSTLLNMLAGLEKPTKGEIIIDGHHIEKMNENKLVQFRRESVGFIFQSFNLLGTMNALENVALPLSFRGMPKELRLKKAMKMLKLVGLKEHALHRPNQMSGGQQQRVGMARALVVNPKIMFADEPTGNLDSRTSKEMMNLMRQVVNEHKKTLIMVTHDDSLAAIADKVIRIVDGKIVKIEDRYTKAVEEYKDETME
ncbi:MAG: ABC transporter ATP-binding protein [Lachnospiraceae bacterium]